MTSDAEQTPRPLSDQQLRSLVVAMAVYLGSLFAANTLGMKVMPLALGFDLSVGAFMFPVVFIMTDVIGEVYGRRVARLFVLAGFVSTALFTLYTAVALAMPWSDTAAALRSSYNQIFGLSARIAGASLLAFIVSEYQDVAAFFFFKRRLGERGFWLRSNLSNLWSQLLDTSLFMIVAFWGVYEVSALLRLVVSWWLFKVAMGVLYTPLAYAGVRLLRGRASPDAGS
ncbi:MAG: queuosine precursor transporter [Gemmatimonadaceae bacterium]|nr:queuosine precursor transporter [Gemmatimonadaceae bacterium]